MVDLYDVIINDPVYLTIAVLLAVSVVFSVVKKLFKFATILLTIGMIYVTYLYYTGEEIPQTTDDLIEDISKQTENAVDDLIDKSEDLKKKVKKAIKDKSP